MSRAINGEAPRSTLSAPADDLVRDMASMLGERKGSSELTFGFAARPLLLVRERDDHVLQFRPKEE